MGSIKQPSWVTTFSMGPVWENGGRTQSFFLTPGIVKTYTANRFTHTLFDGEVFVGQQKNLSESLQGQLGLAVGATSNAILSGHIWDDADLQFDNFVYRYKTQHTYIALKGKLLADMNYWLTPWVSASLGVGFNRAHDFSNTPLIFEALANPNFSSHTKTAFAYTVGVGVQKALTSHWQIGVGYEFADWGQSRLGRAAGQTLNSGLGLNHLYTHGVLFNLSFLG